MTELHPAVEVARLLLAGVAVALVALLGRRRCPVPARVALVLTCAMIALDSVYRASQERPVELHLLILRVAVVAACTWYVLADRPAERPPRRRRRR